MTSPAVKLLAAAGGGGLEPPTVTSQAACWWADDLVGTYGDGDPIDTWTARGSIAVSASGSARPTLDVDGVGGKPGAAFNGTSHRMLSEFASVPSEALQGCVVAVVHFDSAAAEGIWCEASNSNFRYTYGWVAEISTNGRLIYEQSNNDPADNLRSTTTDINAGSAYALEWSSSGTAITMRVNNGVETISVISGGNNGDWFGDSTSSAYWSMGDLYVNNAWLGVFLAGKIAYLMVADAELSSGDRTALYDWINEVYGI